MAVEDVTKATEIVKRYFEKLHGNLGMLLFMIEKVEPNTVEKIWIVDCNLYPSLGAAQRAKYRVKVNIETEQIMKVETI